MFGIKVNANCHELSMKWAKFCKNKPIVGQNIAPRIHKVRASGGLYLRKYKWTRCVKCGEKKIDEATTCFGRTFSIDGNSRQLVTTA